MSGKVVVNRCMSLDGFIAGPGHSMDWGGGRALADFVAPDDFAEVAAATGAMLVGRRTWEVGDRLEAEVRRLNEAIIDKHLPALESSTHATQQVTQLLLDQARRSR